MLTNNMAARPGAVTPGNDEGRPPATPEPNQATQSEIVADLDVERKACATLAAKLALSGFSLHQLAHGGFVVTRWDRVFHSSDLAGVRGFCQRAGVAV